MRIVFVRKGIQAMPTAKMVSTTAIEFFSGHNRLTQAQAVMHRIVKRAIPWSFLLALAACLLSFDVFASVDNPMVAAEEAGSGGAMPAVSVVFGAIGAFMLGWNQEEGPSLIGGVLGFALGSMAGLVVAFLLR
jgi:L-lactate permease